jgi:hypothetical protein
VQLSGVPEPTLIGAAAMLVCMSTTDKINGTADIAARRKGLESRFMSIFAPCLVFDIRHKGSKGKRNA